MGLTVLEAKSPVPGPWTLESYTGVRVAIFALTKEMDCILRSARSTSQTPTTRRPTDCTGRLALGWDGWAGPNSAVESEQPWV